MNNIFGLSFILLWQVWWSKRDFICTMCCYLWTYFEIWDHWQYFLSSLVLTAVQQERQIQMCSTELTVYGLGCEQKSKFRADADALSPSWYSPMAMVGCSLVLPRDNCPPGPDPWAITDPPPRYQDQARANLSNLLGTCSTFFSFSPQSHRHQNNQNPGTQYTIQTMLGVAFPGLIFLSHLQ